MPSFHTKTIEAILDPVANQVSQLVVLHDASADGSAMPDLSTQIMAVNAAVQNLVRVGKETTASSKDEVLKQDMPPAFTEVEDASNSLVEASRIFKTDPHSKSGRKILIEGSRGILGGTAQLLLVFDQAEVRKILRHCQQVLDYIVVAEVIECMEDLVTFVKNLTPGMTAMTKNVETRSKDLTFQIHRELLEKHLESLKSMVPLLVSAVKITVTTISQGGLGLKEAQANRTYVINRMMFDITEIMRVLQLTSYDEDESALDDMAVMKKAQDNIANQMKQAKAWLDNPEAAPGGIGEGAIRQILADAYKVADRADKASAAKVRSCADELRQMMDKLADLRARGLGNTPEALQLSREISNKLGTLQALVNDAVARAMVSGTGKPPATLTGKMEAAQAWLHSANGAGVGFESIQGLVLEGRKTAESLSGPEKKELLDLCNEVEALTNQLNNLFKQGKGNTPEAQAIKQKLDQKLQALQEKIEKALATQIVELFMDPLGPLKQLEKAAKAPPDTPDRERSYEESASIFLRNGQQITDTARWVAEAGTCPDKKIVGELNATANEVSEMNPQLVFAGKIVLIHPENAAATENFHKLRDKYKEKVDRMTELIDEATDVVAFIKASEDSIKRDSEAAAAAISQRNSPTVVQKGGNIARKANRIAIVANKEADNSEDAEFVKEVRDATSQLEKSIPQIVVSTKGIAMNPANPTAQNDWFKSNGQLLIDIERVKRPLIVIIPIEQKPPPPDDMPVRSSQQANLEQAPPPPRNLYSASTPLYQPSEVSSTSPYSSQNAKASPVQGDAFSRPQYVGSAGRPSEYAPHVPPPAVGQATSKADAGLLAPSKSTPAVQQSAGRSPKEFSNEDFFPPPPPSFLRDDPTQQPPPPAPTFVAPSVTSDRPSDVASRLPNTPYQQAEPSQDSLHAPQKSLPSHAYPSSQPTPYHPAPSSSSSSPSSYRPPSDPPQRAPYYQGTSQRSPGSQQMAPPAPTPSWNHAQAAQRGQDQQPVTVDTGVPYSPLVRSPGNQQSYASPFASNRDQSRSPRKVKDDVAKVRTVIQDYKEPPPPEPPLPPPPDLSALSVSEEESAPPRPPPPELQMPPPRPPLPTPDPSTDEPIMRAAYDLHVETEKWSSKGNDLVAAAKRMALLMAQMSSYVRNDDQSSKSKKGLIDCAKAIAAASAEVSRLATEIAKQCTDKRIRMNLMQVCERIPTIATQLKIISTVKATLLGDPDAENEGETTEVLVLNAQNLMGAVKETVRQAEAASIKIRTDAGGKMRWVRKSPWYY